MNDHRDEISDLKELLDRLREAADDGGNIRVGDMLEVIGSRSFGTMLLFAGIITLAPLIGDIPGVPTAVAVFVGLTSVQLLLQRDHLWLPEWMLNRSVSGKKMEKAVSWMQRPAEITDRLLRNRLAFLTGGIMNHVIAVACLFVAGLMPLMEFIPFSANLAGATLTLFGLSLIARDGLMALIAFLFTGLAFGLVIYNLL